MGNSSNPNDKSKFVPEKKVKKIEKQLEAIANKNETIHSMLKRITGQLFKSDSSQKLSLSDKIGFTFQLVSTVLTIISILFVGATLHEMKVERDTAYQPHIVMNPISERIEWDKNGKMSWLVDDNIQDSTTVNPDGSVTGTMHVRVTAIVENSLINYSLVNVGVGSATYVELDWDKNNTERLNKFLLKADQKQGNFCYIGDIADTFQYGSNLVRVDKEIPSGFMYMLPNASETYSLRFPAQYSILLAQMVKNDLIKDESPLIFLSLSYNDIQNNHYQKIMVIKISKPNRHDNEDGSGYAAYQLIPELAD